MEVDTPTQTDMTSSVTDKRFTGQVKWFNNKSGFGFVTCSDEEFSGKDIFVHYSAIRLPDTQYKYLVQGEYVEFNLAKSDNEKHEFNAADVYGVKGGVIMCEMRTKNMSTDRPVRRERPDKVSRGDTGSRGMARPRPTYTKSPDRTERVERPVSTPVDNLDGFTKVEKKIKKPTAKA